MKATHTRLFQITSSALAAIAKTVGGKKTKDGNAAWHFQALLLYGDDLVGPLGESVRAAFGEMAVTRYMKALKDLDEKKDELKLVGDTIPSREKSRENAAHKVTRLREEVEKLQEALNAAELELAKNEEDLRTHKANFERLQGEVEEGRLHFLRRNLRQTSSNSDESGVKRSRTEGHGADDEKRKRRRVDGKNDGKNDGKPDEGKRSDAKKRAGDKHKKVTPPGSRANSAAASPARPLTPSHNNVSTHLPKPVRGLTNSSLRQGRSW